MLPADHKPLGGGIYSKEECEEQSKKMSDVSSEFYSKAVRVGHHQFIEFTGLMNKYIQIFNQTVKAGIDPNICNIHSGGSLVMNEHDVEYMAEKFGCIFETTLKDPAMRNVFLKAMEWDDLISLSARQKQILDSLVRLEAEDAKENVEQDTVYETELKELEKLIGVPPIVLPF